jgi:hypothetical protein
MLAVLSLLVAPAGAQAPKPITKQGLIDALRIGGLSLQELIQFVRDRGVDFQVTPEVEAELRTAAAQRDLIEAVRGSFKGAAAPGAPAVPPAAPLTKSEIVTLLQVGTPPARIEQLVGERGVSFALTLEIGGELQAAGATPTLLEAIARRAPAAAPAPVAAPAAAAPAPAAAPVAAPAAPKSTPNITSLREMKKLYIEKMPNDLDQFLRAEIVKELKDRIVMVLSKEDADAIMTGSGENRTGTGAQITGRYLGLHDNATGAITISDRTGTVVLWSSEAGDRSLFWSSLRRGGPRKVADRLVNNLKKALQ